MAWIIEGHSEADLVEALANHHPDLNPRDLMAAAAQHFQDTGETDPLALRGFCIEAYRELYKKGLAIGDYSNALKALARLERAAK